jgi:hypothetical protein
MTLEHLARIWFNYPRQHAIIVKNIIRKERVHEQI